MAEALKPFHYLANIMDPNYRGQRLSWDQEETAENWVKEHHKEWLPLILAYKIEDEDFFPKNMFTNEVVKQFSVSKWWHIMDVKTSKKGNIPKGFCIFMASLSSCPASSAAIERIFSAYGLVWSKLRNRLGAKTAEKLVKVYNFLNKNKDL